MILSKKRITKALIRLRGWAGWSVPVLFANPEDRFSHVEAHFLSILWPPELKLKKNISLNVISFATGQYIIYSCARIQVSDPGPYGPLVLYKNLHRTKKHASFFYTKICIRQKNMQNNLGCIELLAQCSR